MMPWTESAEIDYTQMNWGGDTSTRTYGPPSGTFGSAAMLFAGTPKVSADSAFIDQSPRPTKVWPATPTPSASAHIAYGFGLPSERDTATAIGRANLSPTPEKITVTPGLPSMLPPTPSLLPGPKVSFDAVGNPASNKEREAPQASQPSQVVVGGLQLKPRAGRLLYDDLYLQVSPGRDLTSPPSCDLSRTVEEEDERTVNTGSTSDVKDNSVQVKNTFIHIEPEYDEEDAVPRSITMPNVWKATLLSPTSSVPSPSELIPMGISSEDHGEKLKALDAREDVLPSVGSAQHGTGKCKPCAWFWKPQKCSNHKSCGYCHLCPEGELKARKKAKVAAMRVGALMPVKDGTTGGAPRVLKLSPLI